MRWLAKVKEASREPERRPKPAPRTFRKCSGCGRMGWHLAGVAAVCCGRPMAVVEAPAMTCEEYAAFIHARKSYEAGAVTRADLTRMMVADGIRPIDGEEQATAAKPRPERGPCHVCGRETRGMLTRPDGSWDWLCAGCAGGEQ